MTTARAPRLLIITDRAQIQSGRTLELVLTECISAGARHLLLRERDLPIHRHAALVDRLLDLLPVGGTLAVASPVTPGTGVGLHLRAPDRVPDVRPRALSRSVHNVAEARRAESEGCDFVTISPVHATASKPGYGPPLEAAGLARILRKSQACPPTLALGGVTRHTVPELCMAGAHGVAVMGSIMRARDPAAVTAGLLKALESTPPPRPSAPDRKHVEPKELIK